MELSNSIQLIFLLADDSHSLVIKHEDGVDGFPLSCCGSLEISDTVSANDRDCPLMKSTLIFSCSFVNYGTVLGAYWSGFRMMSEIIRGRMGTQSYLQNRIKPPKRKEKNQFHTT